LWLVTKSGSIIVLLSKVRSPSFSPSHIHGSPFTDQEGTTAQTGAQVAVGLHALEDQERRITAAIRHGNWRAGVDDLRGRTDRDLERGGTLTPQGGSGSKSGA
jgi:hypothetical protein